MSVLGFSLPTVGLQEMNDRKYRKTVSTVLYLTIDRQVVLSLNFSKDGILGHKFHKRLETCSMLFTVFYWQNLKNHTLLWFQKSLQKISEKRILGSIHEKHVLERNNEGTKPDKT